MLEALLSHTGTDDAFAGGLLCQGSVPWWASGGVSPQQQRWQGWLPVTAMFCPLPRPEAIKSDPWAPPSIPWLAVPPTAHISCPLLQ